MDESGQLAALVVFLGVPAAALTGALYMSLRGRLARTRAAAQQSLASQTAAPTRHARLVTVAEALRDGLSPETAPPAS